MGEKLVPLGGDPSTMPAPLGSEPAEEVAMARLRRLKNLGKL